MRRPGGYRKSPAAGLNVGAGTGGGRRKLGNLGGKVEAARRKLARRGKFGASSVQAARRRWPHGSGRNPAAILRQLCGIDSRAEKDGAAT